jgi:hypothetical protein
MLMGVTLPVSTPSTDTFAPTGNEVTFNAPLPACAAIRLGANRSAGIATNQRILRDWIMTNLQRLSLAYKA